MWARIPGMILERCKPNVFLVSAKSGKTILSGHNPCPDLDRFTLIEKVLNCWLYFHWELSQIEHWELWKLPAGKFYRSNIVNFALKLSFCVHATFLHHTRCVQIPLNLIPDISSRCDQFVCLIIVNWADWKLIKRIDQMNCVNTQSSMGILNADWRFWNIEKFSQLLCAALNGLFL